MPDNGIEGFPNNHLMSSLSDTVENANPSRPVPKPRRSLGVNPPPKQSILDDKPEHKINETENKSPSPPPYSTVADTNPEGASYLPKVCASDTDIDWMVVPRATPTAPHTTDDMSASSSGKHMDNTSDVSNFVMVSLPSSDNSLMNSGLNSYVGIHPVQPPSYYPSNDPIYCNINDITAQPPIGWSTSVLKGIQPFPVSSNMANNISNDIASKLLPPHPPSDNHSRHINQNIVSPLLYPSVPPNAEHASSSCTKNMVLRFGKQGSSVRDFLKPIGLAVSHDEKFIISDNAGDQNRIFIFSSNGELTTAFNCGCKVKDIYITKKNEILAAVHKNVAAIRHFTMAGQCKGEYGKFFTFEEPCGIAEFSSGGVALTGTQNHCVYILTNQMKLSTKFGRKGNGDGYFQNPGFLTVDSKDHVIVTDKVNNSIQIFESDGKFKHRFGSTGNNRGQLKAPMGVCVDNADNIIVADSENHRVEVFSSKGVWLGTVVQNTAELGENVKPVNVAFTPTGKVAVLLRGPYFAEVRVYSSDHKKHMPVEGIHKKKK
ncbi:hypothetical protein Btru_050715 [Bulinus truncatus]|nr:hypothetical protein Btru_050715 [Bulinus truncatus]